MEVGAGGGGGGDVGATGGAGSTSGASGTADSGGTATGDANRQVIPSAAALQNTAERETETETEVDPATGEQKPKKPAANKHKVKRGGKEVEYTTEQILQMLGDDYEHEIPGQDGKPTKLKWADLQRHAQMGQGALTKMREAAAIRQRFDQAIEWGRNPANHGAFLETQLGVKDHRLWAAEVIRAQIKEEAELSDLMTNSPDEYHRRMEERAGAKLTRQQALERQTAQREQQQREIAERRAQVDREATDALKGAGLPLNDTVKSIAHRIFKEYAEVGHNLSWPDLATMTKQAYLDEVMGFVDGHDDDGLLALLGDKRRDKLRKLELRALKTAGKTQGDAEREQQANGGNRTTQPAGGKGKGLTEAEILRSFR